MASGASIEGDHLAGRGFGDRRSASAGRPIATEAEALEAAGLEE